MGLKTTILITLAAVTTAVMFASEVAVQQPTMGPQAAQEAVIEGSGADALPHTTKARTSQPGPLVPSQDELHRLRVKKCEYLVSRLYHKSGFLPYCEFFITEHERRGMGSEWYYSLIYGAANFSLRVGGRAPGRCYGPLDVKAPVPRYRRKDCADLHSGPWRQGLLTEPRINIRCHVLEMLEGYRRGYRGRGLCEYVYFPPAPKDWGGGRFRKTECNFRRCIHTAYQRGDLP